MMKGYLFRSVLLGSLMLLAGVSFGQDATEPKPNAKPVDFRTPALRQLGLVPDQLQRIKRLNMDRKPMMDAAQARLRETNRALDEAVYSDTATETEVQARLKDFQAAQAEVARIRFMHEYGVRRILTPDQLTKFRNMRQRFDQARGNSQDRGVDRIPVRPLQRELLKRALKNNSRNR